MNGPNATWLNKAENSKIVTSATVISLFLLPVEFDSDKVIRKLQIHALQQNAIVKLWSPDFGIIIQII